jgi:hypothetical protein
MSVQIKHVLKRGEHGSERLVIKVLADDDIGAYAVFQVLTADGSVTNAVRHAYWFPDQPVATGDLVVLYTKPGTQSSKLNKNGQRSYFFYWSREEAVWGEDGAAAVLLHDPHWTHLILDPKGSHASAGERSV